MVIKISGLLVAGIGGSKAVPKVSQRKNLASASPKPPQITAKAKMQTQSTDTMSNSLRSHFGTKS